MLYCPPLGRYVECKKVVRGKQGSGTKSAFIQRLEAACDQVPHIIPPYGEGRQIEMAKKMGMSQEGIRKWFAGESHPRRDAMKKLATLLEVDEAWLALGVTPEVTSAEKKLAQRNVDGAVLLVMGYMTLAGASCAQPGDTDPRRAFVDFYAILRGMQFSMHVAYGRETSSGVFILPIPKEFKEARTIGVLPIGKGKFEFMDLPVAAIDQHKSRKGGDYVISMNRIEGRYVTGSYVWNRIKNFEELA